MPFFNELLLVAIGNFAGLCICIPLHSDPKEERNEQQERRIVLLPNGTPIQEWI